MFIKIQRNNNKKKDIKEKEMKEKIKEKELIFHNELLR